MYGNDMYPFFEVFQAFWYNPVLHACGFGNYFGFNVINRVFLYDLTIIIHFDR